ncbi:hypothetical protein [Rhodopseudomonas parapalustris]
MAMPSPDGNRREAETATVPRVQDADQGRSMAMTFAQMRNRTRNAGLEARAPFAVSQEASEIELIAAVVACAVVS